MKSKYAWLGIVVLAAGCSTALAAEQDSTDIAPVAETQSEGKLSDPNPGEVKPLEKVGEKESSLNTSTACGVEVRGTALAVRESYLSAAVPGIVNRIRVERGERVKKNQPLLELDGRGFRLGVQQASAALEGARAQEEQVRTEIARVKELLKSGAAPTATLDLLTAQGKGALASVRMAQAALGQAKKARADAVVKAPYDGVITEILKQTGENAPAMPPTMLLKIVDSSSLEVQAFVPEDAAGQIKKGSFAQVRIDSADADLEGEIIFVSDAISQGARTFEVRVRLDNPNGVIKAGAFARVLFPQPSESSTN